MNSPKNDVIIDAEPTKKTKTKQPKSPPPLKEKKGFSFKGLVLKTVLSLAIIVGLLVVYLLWSGNESKWQIEHINQLQTAVTEVKQKIKILEGKQENLAKTINSSSEDAEANPLIHVELDELKAKIANIKQELSTLKTPLIESDSFNVNAQDLQEIQQKQARLEAEFAQFVVASKTTVKKVDEEKNQSLQDINALSNLSDAQLQQWIMQINNQWLFVGNKPLTEKSLRALLQTVKLSQYSQKDNLISNIHQDLATLKHLKTTSNAPQQVEEIQAWLADIKLNSVTFQASEKTKDLANTDVTLSTADTAWIRIQEKFSALFKVQKRESEDSLSQVAKMLEQNIISQRLLLQAEQLSWAMSIHSKPLVEHSINRISSIIKQHATEDLPVWQQKVTKLNELLDKTSLQNRQALKIAGDSHD